jgi:hypothetical protein
MEYLILAETEFFGLIDGTETHGRGFDKIDCGYV